MPGEIRFLLNGEETTVRLGDPTRTVLQLLRYDLRATGTKEGCAEGDCGACTVVLGSIEDEGTVRYRPVNACILFAPELHGRELITVEGLSQQEGEDVHPVAQALVKSHGSQCGFCTPGFVMALYAHYINGRSCDRESLKTALAGNLCRCTGYGPILEAGKRMREEGPPADQRLPSPVERLHAVAPSTAFSFEGACSVTGKPKRYHAPADLNELAVLLEERPDAVLTAGATDVGLWITKQQRRLEDVVSLTRIRELRRIDEDEEAMRFGAAVSLESVMERVRPHYPDFGEVLRRFGSVQIREGATIGGNIANGSPIGDSMPLLIALGATVELRKGKASREIPLEDLYIDYGKQDRAPGEFVEAVRLPKPRPGLVFKAYKISKRYDQDISAVCGAFALTLDKGKIVSARIAFGGLAPIPKRAGQTEAALEGKVWDDYTLEGAMAALSIDYTPISDMRGSAAYRQRIAQNLLRKAWLESTGDKRPVRVRPAEAVGG